MNQRSRAATLVLSLACACSARQASPAAEGRQEPPVIVVPPASPEVAERQEPPASPEPAPSADLSGIWRGWVLELVPGEDRELKYQVCLQIPTDLDERGSIEYFDGMTCAGIIQRVGSDDAMETFVEVLTSGNVTNGGECADTGRIQVSVNPDGSLEWDWFQIDESVPQAEATLRKVEVCP